MDLGGLLVQRLQCAPCLLTFAVDGSIACVELLQVRRQFDLLRLPRVGGLSVSRVGGLFLPVHRVHQVCDLGGLFAARLRRFQLGRSVVGMPALVLVQPLEQIGVFGEGSELIVGHARIIGRTDEGRDVLRSVGNGGRYI
jgi:hypothetical protein